MHINARTPTSFKATHTCTDTQTWEISHNAGPCRGKGATYCTSKMRYRNETDSYTVSPLFVAQNNEQEAEKPPKKKKHLQNCPNLFWTDVKQRCIVRRDESKNNPEGGYCANFDPDGCKPRTWRGNRRGIRSLVYHSFFSAA